MKTHRFHKTSSSGCWSPREDRHGRIATTKISTSWFHLGWESCHGCWGMTGWYWMDGSKPKKGHLMQNGCSEPILGIRSSGWNNPFMWLKTGCFAGKSTASASGHVCCLDSFQWCYNPNPWPIWFNLCPKLECRARKVSKVDYNRLHFPFLPRNWLHKKTM